MLYSRRALLAAAGVAGVASVAAGISADTHAGPTTDPVTDELIRRSEQANAALLRGDIGTYRSLITLTDDFTLMSPFGGKPSRGVYTDERWLQIGLFFKNGTLRQELVQAYSSADMVVLAIIEHGSGEVGGLPTQEWPLRVTLVYRREGSEWHLAHRHADPLAHGITLEQSAALARAEQGVR